VREFPENNASHREALNMFVREPEAMEWSGNHMTEMRLVMTLGESMKLLKQDNTLTPSFLFLLLPDFCFGFRGEVLSQTQTWSHSSRVI
jgi:hypothetical protein